MTDNWYRAVGPDEPLTQGDLILDCPLVSWEPAGIKIGDDPDERSLTAATRYFTADIVVMTQACDLEHGKVKNVVACVHYPLTEYWRQWRASLLAEAQNPTPKAWRSHANDIKAGFAWNLSMLSSGGADGIEAPHRVVDFHAVHTTSRAYLETLLSARGEQRLRLEPPYREHLSQAFARFFMRVGLPVEVEDLPAMPWG